jgi:pyroglutamyl-peptidase
VARGPTLLVTGFGPFPGAPENPTEALVRKLVDAQPETFGAADLRAVVLPTEYRRSWSILRRLYARLAPDVVVHFGLSARADAIAIERAARRRCASDRPDAVGFTPRRGLARRSGPETLASAFPVDCIVAALLEAGFPAAASDDAGDYVCNATLYRSLAEPAPSARRIGFVHVPPEGAGGLSRERLGAAAEIVLQTACAAWSANAHHHTWTKTDSPSTVTG